MWDTNNKGRELFIEQANAYHPTIKFNTGVSQIETTFLDTTVYKGQRFEKERILDGRTHFKPTETFQYGQYTHFNSCHPAGVEKRFCQRRSAYASTNSSKFTFEENIENFKTRLISRGYPGQMVEKVLSEVKYEDRKEAPKQKTGTHKKLLPFSKQFQPPLPNLKSILIGKWHLIQNQPLLERLFGW